MLSINILSYKNPALLRLCLNSLKKSLPKNLDCEIIVVDNASTEKTRSVVEYEFKDAFSAIKIVPLKINAGYTRGVNEGIRASKGEFMLYINQDIVVIPETIENLLDYFKKNPKIGLLGPGLLNFDESHQNSCFRFYNPLTILFRRMPYLPFAKKNLDRFLMKDVDLSKPLKTDWISGAAFLVSKPAINKVGLMDENLFHYFSDVDWSRRFWENGYEVIYYPTAKLYHYHGQGSRGRFGLLDVLFNKQTRWHIIDGIKYFIKYKFKNINYGIKSTI
ncbi:MAG: hypothetical protein COV30_02165 [Candidatus Yanofskybacteria bacterium CG10_big_fil_rev_8_21_14_0_10_37_15]|uniref:Glycosyltransferase 2-like domain-containing protein n=1 Tax=Candidatus Yanofskybacteria bacterium CG10_big_fil_rev_8_21_14_0_10_37_15 TaxID=1975097 RepID=A0A2H0R5E2_9BACT|nr:MAG: hypothetical protein COV30_02165 [Candidatus Yanofskybacteria bacterium CG10_big_fil_rev_8_21_14_0_10_37_15]